MEREACVCDHGFERSDLCAEIIIIIIILVLLYAIFIFLNKYTCCVVTYWQLPRVALDNYCNTN